MVIWIYGLSGSGKTFLSKKIYNKLNSNEKKNISLTEFFSKILKQKIQISTFGVSDYWYEFDSPRDIIKYNEKK